MYFSICFVVVFFVFVFSAVRFAKMLAKNNYVCISMCTYTIACVTQICRLPWEHLKFLLKLTYRGAIKGIRDNKLWKQIFLQLIIV